MSKIKINQPNSIIISIYDVLSPLQKHLANLENYFNNNLENYVRKNRNDKRIIRLINRIRKEEQIESDQLNIKSIFNKTDTDDDILNKVIEYLVMKSKKFNRPFTPITLLKDWLWSDSLMNGDLKSEIYDYVPDVLAKWRMNLFIKLFSISEADSSGQKLFFQSTKLGDLTKYFNNYIQYFKESKSDKEFYKNIANLLRDKSSNLLFITNELDDLKAASEAGFNCILILKENLNLANNLIKNDKIKITDTIENIEFINLNLNRSIDCC